MESAAHPCLGGPQRQVHMTFLSQAEPSCCDLVERVTSCGKEMVWKRHASVWQEGVCAKRGVIVRTHTHTGQLVLCFSEASSAATLLVRHKAVGK